MTLDRTRLVLRGISASPGIQVAPAVVLDQERTEVPQRHLQESEIDNEIKRLRDAIEASRSELESVRRGLGPRAPADYRLILEAHLMMHRDELLVDGAVRLIRDEGINAEWALRRTVQAIRERLDAMSDAYFRERAEDVEHVGEHILRALVGVQTRLPTFEQATVLVCPDLSPADAANLARSNVVALVTDVGTATSHSAILARALEIPAVVGVAGVTKQVGTGDLLVVDALRGEVILNADPPEVQRAEERARRYGVFTRRLRSRRGRPAETKDGLRVVLHANVELPAEAALAVEEGAAGIGLYRTEFLYLNRIDPPSEDEQAEVYADIVRVMAPRPVIIRTFDVGGDKLPAVERLPRGANPALGLRAIRLALARPEIFRAQLRAILRAAAHGNVKVMFPLVTTVSELREARGHLSACEAELDAAGVPRGRVSVGVMIEVPAAAVMADALARECDFFSVGTNDLVQYTLALDRSNAQVAYLATPLHPAVLRLLDTTLRAASDRGIDVSMCGDMAANVVALPLALGLGFRALSMPVSALPIARELVCRIEYAEARRVALEALSCGVTEDVERLIARHFRDELRDIWSEQGVELPV